MNEATRRAERFGHLSDQPSEGYREYLAEIHFWSTMCYVWNALASIVSKYGLVLDSESTEANGAWKPLRLSLSDDCEVLGVLAATFGQTSADSGRLLSVGEQGSCPGDDIRIVQFGPLLITTVFDDAEETFYGYRLDARLPNADEAAIALSTASGMQIGDTVETLRSIYSASFALEAAQDDGRDPEFRISNATGLLIWGPLTATDSDGLVQGVFVSVVCEDG